MKKLYIIGGPNGAGKTTCAFTVAPEFLSVNEFVNADEIARGISPLNPDGVAVSAGKIMLKRIDELTEQGKSFAIETTCSGKMHKNLIEKCKKLDYEITLIFLHLLSPELALERVACRVKQGGHDIPSSTVRRRYFNGIKNLVNLYIPLCDNVTVYNTSFSSDFSIIARKESNKKLIIMDPSIWSQIEEIGNGQEKNYY